MSHTEEVMTACDWCLQEALVQTISEHLWLFWKIISTEDTNMTSHKNICDKCKSRYEGFSIYIEKCKVNASKVDELLSTGHVKDEPSIDIEYSPLIKKEMSDEADCNSYRPVVSSGVFIKRQMLAGCLNSPTNNSKIDEVLPTGKVKKEPLIDIENHLVNEEDIWKEEASDPDYPTASGGKGKTGLVLRVILARQVLPDFMVLQKKVHNNHTCTYCGKTLYSSRNLKNHLRAHTGDTPFKCSLCNKKFGSLSSLNVHLRIHTGDKTFKCSHCSMNFTRSNYLNDHLRIHIGKKSFKCSYCNKCFTQSSNLNCHLRTHTGEKPFKCSHCNKSYARSSDLKHHSRIHTNDR